MAKSGKLGKLGPHASSKSKDELLHEIEELRARLEESEATVQAIQSGGVDALIVSGPEGERVFVMEGADYPYRVMLEVMNEGVVTLGADGGILSCNNRFAEFLGMQIEQVLGKPLERFVTAADVPTLRAFLREATKESGTLTVSLARADGTTMSSNLSAGAFEVGGHPALCVVVTDLTEMAEAAKTRLWLASIVETTTDAIISKNLDNIVLTWNAAAERIYVFSAQEAIGKPISIIVPPERLQEIEMIRERIRLGQRLEGYETVRITKSGAHIHVALTASPLMDANGTIAGVSVIARDITERKKAEAELERHRHHLEEMIEQRTSELKTANEELCAQREEREELLRENQAQRSFLDLLVHSAPIGIAVLDVPEFTFIMANPWFEGLAETYATKELLGKTVRQISPDLPAEIFHLLSHVYDAGEMLSRSEIELYLGTDQKQTWWNLRLVPLKARDGTVSRILVLVDEVTESVLRKKRIAESEERLALALEATSIGTWDFWPNSGKAIWSDRCKALYGLPSDTEITSDLVMSLVHPEHRESTQKAVQRALDPAGKGVYRNEYRIQRPDGSVRWMSSSAQAVFEMVDGKRQAVRLIGTVIDITDRTLYESALRENEERERARALELKSLAEELARSNKDLEQFALVAAHDLQEPLRQVVGFAEFLAKRYRDVLDQTANEYVDFIVDGGKRMQNLIRDLLKYAKVSKAGQERTVSNLQDVIDKALANLQARIQETNARITQDPMPTLTIDPSQIAQVFQNLIGNALKFRGDKTPEIQIEACQESGQWVFCVRDNGIGFKPEDAERMFQMFQRLHARGQYEGTGIGLAICKRIIDLHGGRIWAESEASKGATFYFTLPA